jgi:sugar phosphate isomerase/epimerase
MTYEKEVAFSVFTKPWKRPIPALGQFLSGLGFDGIELPVRPGYQVEPQNVSRDLPKVVKQLRDHGLKIFSVAGPTDEETFAACAEVGIRVVRIMASIDDDGYLATEARLQRHFDDLLPLLDRYGITLGVQNHFGRFISNASGLRHLIEKYDPKHIAAVWDAAHNALQGEEPELALDLVSSHLCMVNLKNAFWKRLNGPEADIAEWTPYWTNGRHGLASWPRVVSELKRRQYRGTICLTAEYSDESQVDRLIAEDITYAKSLFSLRTAAPM